MTVENSGLEPATVEPPESSRPVISGSATYVVWLTVVILLAYTFVSMDNAFLGLALPTILKDTGWSVSAVGYVTTGGFAMAVIAGFIVGPLADRFGRKRMIQAVMLFTGIFSGLTAIVATFWQFAVVRVLSGTALSEGPLGDALLAEESPSKIRGLLVGIAQAGNPLGNALAGTIATMLLPAGWRPLFIVAFLPALFGIVAINWVREQKFTASMELHVEERSANAYRELMGREHRRHFVPLSFFLLFAIASYGILLVYGPLYMTERGGLTATHAAAVFAVAQWGALIAQILFGWLSDRFSSKWLMFLCVGLGTLSFAAIPLFGSNVAVLTVAMIAATFFVQGTYGVVPRYIAESFPTGIRASAISIAFAFSNVALVIIPSLGGVLFAHGEGTALIWVGAATAFLATLIMAFSRNVVSRGELA